jgi:FAD/FMN-containing dehydrogenase
LLRFNKISFSSDKTQLTVGAGCAFDEIYKVIRPEHYNIVGGGGSVGIGGWMLGGGYSLKTNQFGLGIDNLIQATVVLPDGSKVVTASGKEGDDHDLFWAIRVCSRLDLWTIDDRLTRYELRVVGITLVSRLNSF